MQFFQINNFSKNQRSSKGIRVDSLSVATRQFVQTTFRTIAKNPTFRTRTIGTKLKPDISYKIKLNRFAK